MILKENYSKLEFLDIKMSRSYEFESNFLRVEDMNIDRLVSILDNHNLNVDLGKSYRVINEEMFRIPLRIEVGPEDTSVGYTLLEKETPGFQIAFRNYKSPRKNFEVIGPGDRLITGGIVSEVTCRGKDISSKRIAIESILTNYIHEFRVASLDNLPKLVLPI